MKKSQSTPILIRKGGQQAPLERIKLGGGQHSEDWLQALIHDHPGVLPIADIEPGFGDPIAIAREVPCGHGSIDNLLLTPAGEIIVVEAKLWRNSQARREVVAQALDYVAALTGLGYDALEAMVAKAQDIPATLYAAVADHSEALEESAFIDAVALNLRRGRMLVIALGDGIRQEAETLAGLLQSHAGSHFTFALVELGIWRNPDNEDMLAIPNTLAQTLMIERGIVRVEDGRPIVAPVPEDQSAKPQSLSMTAFYELMAARDRELPAAIRSFIDRVAPLGVYPDLMASLNFRADLPELKKSVNFGYIQKNGQLWVTPSPGNLPEEIWRPYLIEFAHAIGGDVLVDDWQRKVIKGKSVPRIEEVLPAHAERWAAAIAAMIERIRNSEALQV